MHMYSVELCCDKVWRQIMNFCIDKKNPYQYSCKNNQVYGWRNMFTTLFHTFDVLTITKELGYLPQAYLDCVTCHTCTNYCFTLQFFIHSIQRNTYMNIYKLHKFTDDITKSLIKLKQKRRNKCKTHASVVKN